MKGGVCISDNKKSWGVDSSLMFLESVQGPMESSEGYTWEACNNATDIIWIEPISCVYGHDMFLTILLGTFLG